jgi:hypothetical protein
MKRIRVNTDQLHSTAGDFETAAADIIRTGDEALSVAMSLPEYGGRLSGPARSAGYEIQRRCREMGGGCRDAAAALDSAARGYEAVDGRAVERLRKCQSYVHLSVEQTGPLPDVPIKTGGRKDVLGYEDYGDYVVLWKKGESVTVYRTLENMSMINQYIKDVDDFCRYCAEVAAILQEMIRQSLSILPSLILFIALQGGGIVDFLKVKFPDWKGLLDYVSKFMGLIGLSATEWIEKLGVDVPSFSISEYSEEIEELMQTVDLANAAYADAERIWEGLHGRNP